MNEQPVIRFENVSKQFTYSNEKARTILETLVSPFQRSPVNEKRQTLLAMENVSFDIFSGQSVGIIGRNGSGKSTALKLMTRILKPSSGRIWVHGKISALLELGAGFHPDLTGRENIYLNASLLGLSKQEVALEFDNIVDFSELGDFINMPVKHYSSGMYMRLGFSVAIHVKPEILIVDEILAVGDQAFQAKCLDRIHAMKYQGVTFIMVSHDLNMMRRMCNRLIWLEHGKLQQDGHVDEVAEHYQAYTNHQQTSQEHSRPKYRRVGNGDVEITAVRILDENGVEENIFKKGDKLAVEMDYIVHKPNLKPEFGLRFYRLDGIPVSGKYTSASALEIEPEEGCGTLRYSMSAMPFTTSPYLLTVLVKNREHGFTYDHHEQAYSFSVIQDRDIETWGVVDLEADWELLPNP